MNKLNLYKFEQLALSLTIIPWMAYIRTQLTLSEKFHFVLDKLYVAIVFIFILLSAIALLYPKAFNKSEAPVLDETARLPCFAM